MDAVAIALSVLARGIDEVASRAAQLPARLGVDATGTREMELELEPPERDLIEVMPDESAQRQIGWHAVHDASPSEPSNYLVSGRTSILRTRISAPSDWIRILPWVRLDLVPTL